MALVSPGISITVNDQSQLVNSNVGSIPLVVMATAQDKTYNSSSATGTSKANAGKLQAFNSQRELVTAMGTPTFQTSSAGTPVNGSEINEYGLMTAYSALGLTNQIYAIRADIDLNQLVGTSIRPDADPANGTYWLNTNTTDFGLFSLNATTGAFSAVTPLIITTASQVFDDSNFAYNVPTPQNYIGQTGSYAFVMVDANGAVPSVIRLFYKAGLYGSYGGLNNTWVQVGSANWQNSLPVLTGTVATPSSSVANQTVVINGTTVNIGSTNSITAVVSAINTAAIAGVKAVLNSSGYLTLFVTSSATNGAAAITDANNIFSKCGITLNSSGTYYCPYFFYGNYAQAPSGGWLSTDSQPRPTGSIWWKTTSTGGGYQPVLSQWSTSLDTFNPLTASLFGSSSVPASLAQAIYSLDSAGGGINIAAGQIVGTFGIQDTTSNNLQFWSRLSGQTVGTSTGTTNSITPSFASGNTYTLNVSQPGSPTLTPYSITTSGTTANTFVYDILSANIPYVTAQVNANGSISVIHTAGGEIYVSDGTGTPWYNAGFRASGTNIDVNQLGQIIIDNWMNITNTIQYEANAPYSAPASGTLWYYSNPADVDIMINNNGWKGYRVGGTDARGYTLGNTDINGVIFSAGTAPKYQSNGTTAVVAGDIWLDTSDLVNYPKLYRYTGSAWVAIDNTDHVTSNGIIFADARWDGYSDGSGGKLDIVTGTLPVISDGVSQGNLFSNYIDLDAPDYRLYPRGTLLFNTRRSGYNVKKFVPNYFSSTNYPTLPISIPNTPASLPQQSSSWVTASGLNSKGVMNAGSAAQRALVVEAMQSAIDSNTDVLESIYNFNLLVAPGYPEVLSNLINLNNNRSNTGFVIGDTPMTLAPNTIAITNWVQNSTGNGLSTVAQSDPYTAIYYPAGQTNDLAGNTIVVPASHAVLRTFLHNDQVAYPWFAPAGVNRGLVSNLNDIGYIDATSGAFVHNGINQGLRDALYPLKINPLTQLPGSGLVIWGQQTRNASSSAQSSVNVARLENYLRTIFTSVSNGYLFEPNDQTTRTSIARVIEGALNNVMALRGLYDFLVICDSSNNTSTTIANQQLFVDVAIEPIRDVEFIYIPIAIYNPGVIAGLGTSST